ncbi:brachyurin-like [Artemia franciscana]|uniref:Peptidase S1 domain-containing protein n=2 Tax=Artemia franciscana TaxID=6661 RepID=A0AA88HML7_ARTSF|nr:hypothetical protein QYM36_011672 [Artemia franciscana]
MKQFALLLLLAVTALASPYRPYRDIDWSKIKFRTPKVPPHTLKLIKHDEPQETYEIPSDAKNFRAVCGNGNRAEAKIVGGQEVVPHSWPWQVGVYIDGMYFCGGSLISDTTVLTAAHCTDGASFFRVVLGAHEINNGNEAGRIEVTTSDFKQHNRYNSFLISNDIAVIRLPEPVTFTETISPVCLPTSDDVGNTFVGEMVTPTGWGRPSDSTNSISPVLREVDAPVMTNADCDAVYGIVTDSQICIDTTGGKSTCNGDSGGPLNYLMADGTYKTLGITSFGSSAGCEKDYPAAFVRVTAYLDWIASNAKVIG